MPKSKTLVVFDDERDITADKLNELTLDLTDRKPVAKQDIKMTTVGFTGWIDDGTNFRIYFENGLAVRVTDTSAGGHS